MVVEVLEGCCKCTAVTQTEMNGNQVFELALDEGQVHSLWLHLSQLYQMYY